MAKTILNDAYFAAGVSGAEVDLSDHVRSVAIEMTTDIVDATGMTDAYKDKLAGMTDWKVTVEFAQDYAAGKVDDTLFPLMGADVSLKIRPSSAALGPSNPQYAGTGIMSNYTPLDGKVSALNTNKVTFEGRADLTRRITT
jgi:hypothetical protein